MGDVTDFFNTSSACPEGFKPVLNRDKPEECMKLKHTAGSVKCMIEKCVQEYYEKHQKAHEEAMTKYEADLKEQKASYTNFIEPTKPAKLETMEAIETKIMLKGTENLQSKGTYSSKGPPAQFVTKACGDAFGKKPDDMAKDVDLWVKLCHTAKPTGSLSGRCRRRVARFLRAVLRGRTH